MFTTELGTSKYADRAYVLLYGPPKIGKTHAILDLASRSRGGSHVIVYLSVDRGLIELHRNAGDYQGRVVVEEDIRTLKDVRRALDSARSWVTRIAKKKDRGKIWVALDTVTHLQNRLLAEARRINIKAQKHDVGDEYIREMVTEVDWGVNLGHMSEVADALDAMPCNVVTVALERDEKIDRKETGYKVPGIRGQSFDRFTGDADAILRVTKGKSGARYFRPMHGDRLGVLEEREPADLAMIQRKLTGRHVPEPENEEAGQE